MTNTNQLSPETINFASLGNKMLIGAVPALVLIILFLTGVGEGDPTWGDYWMVRPLLVVPAAGAMGGAFYYFMDHLGRQFGWNNTLIIVLSLFVYIIGLWLGFVLGLAGTMWD